MSDTITFTVDGVEVTGRKGQTIIQAADDAGIYIPRLCWTKKLKPGASCRLCTVLVNNRPTASCTQPIGEGMVVLNETEQLITYRKNLVEMLFVEGNHFCMFCEKSGNCELQAMAYRFGIAAPKFPYMFPKRELDASHPDIFLDRNRCILCGRCVRASRDLDGKGVFQFVGRGNHKKIGVNAEARLADTNVDVSDDAVGSCPVGAILKKRVGFAVPVGQRLYDHQPIGSDTEAKARRSARGK
ncbi:(2Fe-2S)-binding protein [Candidatus Poribacteria bacterium]|nr:(2Fe-2S)-binding protein [Candidatus Poribacteria bacterium]